MANLARKLQKVFGDSGGATEFGKIGSDALGSPATSKDLDDIQSLAPYEGGLYDITASASEPPRIEDINALYFLITTQLKYLFQKGIPEWIATEQYYENKSFVTDGAGGLYRCVADSLNNNPATDDGTYWQLMSNEAQAPSIKVARENGKYIGEIFELDDQRDPAGWTLATPATYFPALCLTAIQTYVDIDVANWPDLVPYLRAKKVVFKDGITGEIASPGVTNWAISANVATLTFTNDADHIAMLAALLEDEVLHGGYSNWRSVTLANAIGNVTAGEYAITNVNASSRTISFAFVAGNASGSGSFTVDFYAHRIPGSTTTARVFSARGLTIHGANDDNGYFVAGGLRRRGFMQQITGTLASARNIFRGTGTTGAFSVTDPSNSGTDGGSVVNNYEYAHFNSANSPGARTSQETHGPALTVHIYQHGGRYLP